MKIAGLQKLTLLDYPEHLACTLFTNGCNFRCPFCQNAGLVVHVNEQPQVSEEELFEFLLKRKEVLQGVCITGGEPTLQPDLVPFIDKIKDLGYFVKLDTNGSNPILLKYLIETGKIDYIAMDIKNSKEKYKETIGEPFFDIKSIEESINILLTGTIPYEFRTTVVREFHKENDFISIGKWINGADKYYLQAFKDSGDLIQNGLHSYSKQEMIHLKNIVSHYVTIADIRGID